MMSAKTCCWLQQKPSGISCADIQRRNSTIIRNTPTDKGNHAPNYTLNYFRCGKRYPVDGLTKRLSEGKLAKPKDPHFNNTPIMTHNPKEFFLVRKWRLLTANWAPYREDSVPGADLAQQMGKSSVPSFSFILYAGARHHDRHIWPHCEQRPSDYRCHAHCAADVAHSEPLLRPGDIRKAIDHPLIHDRHCRGYSGRDACIHHHTDVWIENYRLRDPKPHITKP